MNVICNFLCSHVLYIMVLIGLCSSFDSCFILMNIFMNAFVCRSQQVATNGGNYALNLSTQCLSVKTCGILAKLLATSCPFVDIKFNDCSLPDEGMAIDD